MARRWRLALVAAAVIWGSSARPASASEFYYVLIFGSQPHPKQLKYSHTWATFARAVGEGPDPSTYALGMHTLSWVPRSLDVKVWTHKPEPGLNLDLAQTFAMTDAHHEHVTMWGPFQIRPEVYARSLQEKQALESGLIQYRAIDGARNYEVSDCIHAVAAVDPQFGRRHYPLIRIGNSASRYIARQIIKRGAYHHATADHSWLIPRLGLNAHPMTIIAPSTMSEGTCLPF